MLTRVAVLVLLTSACAAAQSQQPPPSAGQKEQRPQPEQADPTQPQPTPDAKGSNSNPLSVRIVRSDAEAAEDRDERRDQRANRWTALWLSGFTVAGLLAQIGLLVFQLRLARRQNQIIDGQSAIMREQATHMAEGIKEAQAASAAARENAEAAKNNAQAASENAAAAHRAADNAATQADLMREQLASAQRIERAYVTMSHAPPGVLFAPHVVDRVIDGESVSQRDGIVRVGVENFGNTPALVTAYTIHELTVEPIRGLPPPYRFDRNQIVRVHIPKGDAFNITYRFSLHAAIAERVINGTATLCIIGFVDYIDRFDGRHRVGYARQYDPTVDVEQAAVYWDHRGFNTEAYNSRNNLPFVTIPGYNYDRERKKGEHGEGHDWEEQ